MIEHGRAFPARVEGFDVEDVDAAVGQRDGNARRAFGFDAEQRDQPEGAGLVFVQRPAGAGGAGFVDLDVLITDATTVAEIEVVETAAGVISARDAEGNAGDGDFQIDDGEAEVSGF